MRFASAFAAGLDQQLNLFGDAQGSAPRQTAPFGGFVAIILHVQAEADELILLDRLRDAGELRNGGPPQRSGAVEGRVKSRDLLGRYRTHEFGGEVQGLVAEVETQPVALRLVDVDILCQQIEKLLRFLHHAGEFVERYAYPAPV